MITALESGLFFPSGYPCNAVSFYDIKWHSELCGISNMNMHKIIAAMTDMWVGYPSATLSTKEFD